MMLEETSSVIIFNICFYQFILCDVGAEITTADHELRVCIPKTINQSMERSEKLNTFCFGYCWRGRVGKQWYTKEINVLLFPSKLYFKIMAVTMHRYTMLSVKLLIVKCVRCQ